MATTSARAFHALKLPVALAALALVLAGTAVALWPNGHNARDEAAVAASKLAPPSNGFPAGVITYEITGRGLFTASGSGEQLGTTTYEQMHADGHVASPVESAASPDGRLVASVVRNETGVFLAVTDRNGSQLNLTQVAAGSDPQLVAGGKGHARAVDGVPLVVAWSPDSSHLAFGSVTGAPYTLGVMSSPSWRVPAITYSEVSGGYVGELAWSPDGTRLAISTYSMDRLNHSVLLYTLGSESVSRLADGCHITWSPDSEYVAVHRDPGAEAGAWVIAAENFGDRWAISREAQAFPLTWREG